MPSESSHPPHALYALPFPREPQRHNNTRRVPRVIITGGLSKSREANVRRAFFGLGAVVGACCNATMILQRVQRHKMLWRG
jgi:hypothetical protein